MPKAAIAGTLVAVAGVGRCGREAGVFWLGDRSLVSAVRAVVLLRGRGVIEAGDRWVVGPDAYGAVARHARGQGMTLLGSAHTHGRGASVGLSPLDRRHGVRVPEILAVVIGDGGAERDHTRWSWNIFDEGDFRELEGEERARRITVDTGEVDLWRANADGVLPWVAGDE